MSEDLLKDVTQKHYIPVPKLKFLRERIHLIALASKVDSRGYNIGTRFDEGLEELVKLELADRKLTDIIYGGPVYFYTLTERGKEIAAKD